MVAILNQGSGMMRPMARTKTLRMLKNAGQSHCSLFVSTILLYICCHNVPVSGHHYHQSLHSQVELFNEESISNDVKHSSTSSYDDAATSSSEVLQMQSAIWSPNALSNQVGTFGKDEDAKVAKTTSLNVSSPDSPYALIDKFLFSEVALNPDNKQKNEFPFRKNSTDGSEDNHRGPEVDKEDVWLSDGGLLVLKGGLTSSMGSLDENDAKWWEPLDAFEAPYKKPVLPPADFVPSDTGVGVPLPPENERDNNLIDNEIYEKDDDDSFDEDKFISAMENFQAARARESPRIPPDEEPSGDIATNLSVLSYKRKLASQTVPGSRLTEKWQGYNNLKLYNTSKMENLLHKELRNSPSLGTGDLYATSQKRKKYQTLFRSRPVKTSPHFAIGFTTLSEPKIKKMKSSDMFGKRLPNWQTPLDIFTNQINPWDENRRSGLDVWQSRPREWKSSLHSQLNLGRSYPMRLFFNKIQPKKRRRRLLMNRKERNKRFGTTTRILSDNVVSSSPLLARHTYQQPHNVQFYNRQNSVVRAPIYSSTVRRSGNGYASFVCGGRSCQSWGYSFRMKRK